MSLSIPSSSIGEFVMSLSIPSRFQFVLACFCGCALAATANAASIGLNLGADLGSVGANTAGVVVAGNWNDIPLAQQTNLALMDSNGVTVAGLTFSTSETFVVPGTASSATGVGFASPGDSAMMTGHIYHGGGNPVDLTFTGTIPYSQFDVYVYFNSSGVDNSQTFSILDSSQGSLGLSRVGSELVGGDATFVESNYQTGGSANNANYVRFAGLTSADVPTNFIIRAAGNDGTYGYFNGLQIVEVPEPASGFLLFSGVIATMIFRRSR